MKIRQEMVSIISCLRSESRYFAEIYNQYLSLRILYTNKVKLVCPYQCIISLSPLFSFSHYFRFISTNCKPLKLPLFCLKCYLKESFSHIRPVTFLWKKKESTHRKVLFLLSQILLMFAVSLNFEHNHWKQNKVSSTQLNVCWHKYYAQPDQETRQITQTTTATLCYLRGHRRSTAPPSSSCLLLLLGV